MSPFLQWRASLGFVSKRYGITFKPFPMDSRTRYRARLTPDASVSPAANAADPVSKTVWIEERSSFNDWIHEVAHILCLAPWEKKAPAGWFEGCNEFAALFAFERRLALDLYLRGKARITDYRDVVASQQMYTIPIELAYLDGLSWNEWRKVPRGVKQRVLNRSSRICRDAGLFTTSNLPTYRQADWAHVDRSTWNTWAPEISDVAERARTRKAVSA